jgi:hypothetical protein
MRLDEPEQVDMVLGEGARDRGATADLISNDPATGAGVAYVRLATDPDPVRVRAAWVTDHGRVSARRRLHRVIRRTTTQPVRSIKGQRPRTAAPIS